VSCIRWSSRQLSACRRHENISSDFFAIWRSADKSCSTARHRHSR